MGVINSACGGCFGETQKPKHSPDIPETIRTKPKKSDSTEEDFEKDGECCKKQDDCVSADHCLHRQNTDDEKYKPTLSDFHLIKILGQGSFGKVCLVQKKSNRKYYALKGLKKKDLVLENLLKNALTERNILKEIEHPFIVQLKYAFQSKSRVYMVMDFCTGGDLYSRMRKEGKFDEKTVKFYAAEIVLALEYLHEKLNTIHRDIKPENILIASDGHVKITDFGIAKAKTKALTFCGTLYYVAPEIISGQTYGQEVDWWSLGCLMYEMLTGNTPFGHGGQDNLADSILHDEPDISHNLSDSLRDLLIKLMTKDPQQRLGSKGAEQIKEHSFFEGVNWEDVLKKKLTPPFRVAFTKQEITPNPDMYYGLESIRMDESRQHGEHVDLPQFAYVAKDLKHDALDLQTK